MRWWIFIPVLFVAVAFDAVFMPLISIAGFRPALAVIVLAFVALHSSRTAAVAAGLVTGLYMDALAPVASAQGGMFVIGPHMVACVVAVVLVLQLRDVLFRKTPIAIAAGVLTLAAVQSLAFVAIAGLRLSYADSAPLWGAGSGARAFGFEMGDALYSAVLALPLAWLLLQTIEAWGFEEAGPRFAQ